MDARRAHTLTEDKAGQLSKLIHCIVVCDKLISEASILTVAHKKTGIRLLAMSLEIASENASGESA